ncbi:hypothetical protein HW555_003964 [Spodoptera exigua]|uniref:SWI/SNF-related matrix-associated actin-dependent regulator of chromatin subfamily A-like protein 1 n=1 Tax=Spodoptera exigua TaxID=7107 RepID=A0A835GMJ3_SPOEX|nr:hypothetical protein HW555_003964 [Spodoptera exigua]
MSEEIERKRLAALQKRQNLLANRNTPVKTNPAQGGSPLPSSSNSVFKSFASSLNRSHPYAKPKGPESVQENKVPIGKVVTGTVYLISEDRFEVNPSEFCTPLINIFKSLPSKSYDSKSKLWNFSINDYQQLMSKVAPLAPHVVLGLIPPYVLKVLKEDAMDPSCVDLTPIEVTLRHKLMPFQVEGVKFGISRRGRCMIADDMGLGKTFQALAIASYYRHNWPLLIVTTSSMRYTWQSKIQELLPSVPMMNVVTLTSGKETQLIADKQITSMYTDLLKSKKFGVVIIDESHYLKSHKAQCTMALRSITRQCARAVLLSGTPALSRPAELYTQLSLIEPGFFTSYTDYGKRYCDGKQTNFGWDMTGQSNLTELQIILQKRFLIRRTKEQVLTKLEEKTRETVLLDQTLLDYSQDTEKNLSEMANAYKTSKSSDKQTALITYFSESAKVKIPAVKYIRELVSSEPASKFLVFGHHRAVIDAVCLTLDEAAVSYICIVGSTPAGARAELVDTFQNSPSCRCAVLSITAANSGITLTAANLVLFAELHWNPGILTQAESRAHRIGQSARVSVLNNVGLSKDTFEDNTLKHQDSENNITQYLTPCMTKNKNDYVPGTNIRKDSMKENENTSNDQTSVDDVDRSFLDDDEDDELLANLDL